MSIRFRTTLFALLLASPALAACAAEPTAPVDARNRDVSADVDSLQRKPTIPWN